MAIPILKHQASFLQSNVTHTGLVAGFGSGKSIAGTLKTIEKKKEYPGVDVAYYLPTYPLIKDVAFPNFSNWLERLGVPYQLNRTDKEFLTPLGRIMLRSMDNPSLIVAYEVGYSLIDEADILPFNKMKDVFVKIVARNRKNLPNNDSNCVDMVSTPEGFNFMYDFFVKNPSENRVLIKAKTADNPYLPNNYIPMLKEIYTEQQLEAYLNGEFINLNSGSVHHTFDRNLNHSDREIKPREPLHIGMDFNITNMSAVTHVTDASIVTAVDEITKAYDTPDMISVIKSKYSGHPIVVYPDASGDSRKTSASSTDIQLLRAAGFTVRVNKSNPSVKDRVTKMNSGFKDGNGRTDYYVNTNNCPEYTECLEKLAYKNGVPDKSSGFDHLPEAGGYCYYEIKRPSHITFNVR